MKNKKYMKNWLKKFFFFFMLLSTVSMLSDVLSYLRGNASSDPPLFILGLTLVLASLAAFIIKVNVTIRVEKEDEEKEKKEEMR